MNQTQTSMSNLYAIVVGISNSETPNQKNPPNFYAKFLPSPIDHATPELKSKYFIHTKAKKKFQKTFSVHQSYFSIDLIF